MNGLSLVKWTFRTAGAVAAAWVALSLLGLAFDYAALIPVWAMSIAVGVGCTLIVSLYRRERRIVAARTGLALVILRCAAFCIVAFILMKPVLHRTVMRHIERTVAVLIDSSDSMRFADREWDASERVSIGRAFGLVKEREILLPSLEPLVADAAELRPWLGARKMPPAARKVISRTRRDASRLLSEASSLDGAAATNPAIRAIQREVETSVVPALAALDKTGDAFMAESAFTDLQRLSGPARTAASEIAWDSLPASRRSEIQALTETSRVEIAVSLLTNSLPALYERYGVRHFDLGRRLLPLAAPCVPTGMAYQCDATDYASALETLLSEIPSEQLAGVVLLSDGIDNGEAAVEPVARLLGSRSVRVDTVLVGSSRAPFDIALADVSAPESVFLGDKVRVRGVVAASGAAGQEARARLELDGETVDEVVIPISDDAFRREFALSHSPSNAGLARYVLSIENIEGEMFPSNNSWKVDVAASDDRTNVLLIDDYPRWDFRYLRNLFFARDKSVHLQYLLMHPDDIADIDTTNRPPAASASRPFGEAEAGALPDGIEEWRKFDVIILGDVGPDAINEEAQRAIAECVKDRGALLVTIAGPRAMPHAYPTNSILSSLLPFDWEPSSGKSGRWAAPEKAFSLALTPQGKVHPVMQQSSSASENDQVWASIQKCHWRLPVVRVRAGAEVIAYAEPETEATQVREATTARNAVAQLEEERERRERQALIVAHNAGRGKVLALNTDESWRLRYRIGDVRHHRFWGQVLRWGAGERLRSGTERLRVGTERLTYAPHEPVRVIARALNEKFSPVEDAVLKVRASMAAEGEGTPPPGETIEATLSFIAGSHGLYEAILPPFGEPGVYKVEIPGAARYSGGETEVSATFFVASSRRPLEMSQVAASRKAPDELAKWTGGRVVMPHEAADIAEDFGEGSRTVPEEVETAVWCDPWLLALLLALVFAEWSLRKARGLV